MLPRYLGVFSTSSSWFIVSIFCGVYLWNIMNPSIPFKYEVYLKYKTHVTLHYQIFHNYSRFICVYNVIQLIKIGFCSSIFHDNTDPLYFIVSFFICQSYIYNSFFSLMCMKYSGSQFLWHNSVHCGLPKTFLIRYYQNYFPYLWTWQISLKTYFQWCH